MRVAVGTDHGGFHLKPILIRTLEGQGHRVIDVGTFSSKPCDYPPIGARVAQAVSRGKVDRGLLLCKSGAGMAIVANKFPGVRAAVAHTIGLAKHSREHNDANLLVLGANHTSTQRAKGILTAWLATPFAGGRHARRVRQIQRIEERIFTPPSSSRTRGSGPRSRISRTTLRVDSRWSLPPRRRGRE